jgi:hypothetical protein
MLTRPLPRERESLIVCAPVQWNRLLVRTAHMAERHLNTVDEWLDRFMDLDAYLAKGGSLLDLPVSALDGVPPAMVNSIVKRMGRERLDHHVRAPVRGDDPAPAAAQMNEIPAQDQPRAASDEAQRELH